MENKKLTIWTRIVLVVCGISMIAVLFTPIWKIDLDAPQYPEGLRLLIYADDIRGDVDIINGLNHYIGMKTLHKEDFPEFTILPYCIGFFVVFFLLAALVNRKKWFYFTFLLFVAFGIVAMIDFWRWEYDYGHNLDPNAAIVVPGMAYQPPLIGFKQLLNFGAYSFPDIGGLIFIGSGALLLGCTIMEWRKSKKIKKSSGAYAMILILLLSLSSCSTAPEPLKIGTDNCTYCKMTVSDPRYGAEIVTSKGKIYKFDDIPCMRSFLQDLEAGEKTNAKLYLTDFCGNHELIEVDKSFLLKSYDLQSPMGGHTAAFSNIDSMNHVKSIYEGDRISWTQE